MSRQDEFAEFVHARSTVLHRAAYLMVGDVALAQDLVQEALVKTYAAWGRLRDKGNAEAYCRKAITTTAISWFRRKSWSAERPTEILPETRQGGHGDDRGTDPTGAPGTAAVTWATGSTLHTPDGDRDLGHPIAAYVRTSAGYVFTDGSGGVYSAVDDRVTRVGDISERLPQLFADGDGPLVAWVDQTTEKPQFVVFDQAAGTDTSFGDHTEPRMGTLADEKNPAYVFGVDGRTAYWRDTRGAVAVNVDTGEARIIDPAARSGFDVLAVENGVIAFNAGDKGTAIGTSRDEAVMLPDVYGSLATFSPDARWVSVDADEPQVYETATGKRVELDIDGRWFATGYEWLDESTLALISAEDEQDAADLLTCDVRERTCAVVVADIGTFEELADGFALPVGSTIED